jgi:hypothetical protein
MRAVAVCILVVMIGGPVWGQQTAPAGHPEDAVFQVVLYDYHSRFHIGRI